MLVGKLWEKVIGLRDPEKTNLSYRIPEPVNSLLAAVMSSERHLLTRMSFPFGHSLIGVFRKR